MAAELKTIAALPNESKKAAYLKLIEQLVKKQDTTNLLPVVEHLVRKEGAEQYGRTYITPECLVFTFKSILDAEDPMPVKDVLPFAQKASDVIREKADDFPDALWHCISLLAQAYEGIEDYKKAGFARTSFKFDQYRLCKATNEEKLEWYIETAEDWLQCQETGQAAQQLTRAHALVYKGLDVALKHRFDTIYARVKDSERKFLEASMKYLDISLNVSVGISEADLQQTLENAVTTCILAGSGPSRSRLLRTLYSDERTKNLRNYDMLEKMFKEQIVRPQDVQRFEKLLAEHQNAVTKNGLTVLQNAIIEHNMSAASKIYNNIRIDELARLLNISAKQAEELASGMIEQRRLNGTIDQVAGIIEFAEEDSSGSGVLHTWDAAIQDACTLVNSLVDSVVKRNPQYADLF